MPARIAVIIPAAGSSSRYQKAGAVRSKLDEDLGGKSVLQRSIEIFSKVQSPDWEIGTVVVAGPHDDEGFAEFKLRHGDKLGFLGVTLVRGGRTHRYETVAAALKAVSADHTHIAVHDAARPCAPFEMVEGVLDSAVRRSAVVPGLEVGDTLKRTQEVADDAAHDPLAAILGDDAPGAAAKTKIIAVETMDRRGVYAVQTPQVFEAELFRRAYSQADLSSTDDASLVERLGEEVVIVPGDVRNIKITRPADLALARAIMGVAGPAEKPAHLRF
jgi:2-C-methyl-D-erythritol 4-phosphate cytidylyltransferase